MSFFFTIEVTVSNTLYTFFSLLLLNTLTIIYRIGKLMIYFMNKTEKIPHCRDSSNYNEKKWITSKHTYLLWAGACT